MAFRLVASACLVTLVCGERLKDSIYTDFNQFKACFKRLNGTMEFGCTSEQGGNVGVLQYIDSQDISVLENGEFGPYIVLLSPDLFSGSMLDRLKSTGNVNGVVLPGVKAGKWKGKLPSAQSDDAPCPNGGSSLYSSEQQRCGDIDKPWNKAGENILWRNWEFPIFLIEDENTTQSLYDCYIDHNSGPEPEWPLCAVELSSPMYAAKDSETCWRRSTLVNSLAPQHYCDPLSDDNVFYFTSPRNRTRGDNSTREQSARSVIVVLARLDALNVFDKEEVGFDSPTTGIVTLLTVAKMLKQILRSSVEYRPGVENILFLLVHGESFDYIGSSRVVYDMMNESFPFNLEKSIKSGVYINGTQPTLNLDSIRLIVELGQLSNAKSGDLYLHTANSDQELTALVENLRRSQGLTFRLSNRKVLPPASAQSFLKERGDIPVLMVTNYDDQYSNSYYHSIYDNGLVNNYNYSLGETQAVVGHLSQLSQAVAQAVYTAATGRTAVVQGDSKLVNELLYCYTESANCTLYKDVSQPNSFPWIEPPRTNVPFPQYIGVHSSYHTLFTKQLLQYFTGDLEVDTQCPGGDCSVAEPPSVEDQQASCLLKNTGQTVYKYIFLIGQGCHNVTDVQCGKCYRTTVDLSPASSPAFLEDVIKTYDWSSGKYPTWTESIWKSLSGRMFLKPSPASQHFTLAIGVIVLILSFGLVFWVERKTSVLFQTLPPSATPHTNPVSL